MRSIGPLAGPALRRPGGWPAAPRGSISVEFVLVTSFIFVPPIVVGVDFGGIALN